MHRASVFVRAFALLIDILFLFLVHLCIVVAAFAGHSLWVESNSFISVAVRLGEFGPVLSLSFLCVVLYYFTSLTADGEQTIGKSITGVRVVTRDGDNLGRVRACIRCICYLFSALPFFLGFLMAFIFWGNALHDILCGTMVVKVTDDR